MNESFNAPQSTSNKLRFAVVGLGHIAQAAVLPAFRKRKIGCVLKALVSDTPKKLETLSGRYGLKKTFSYDQYETLLDSGEIDAVYIATPNSEHSRFVIPALERGIHVLCEKPLAPTADECRRMIQVAERTGARLMTAYRLHFDPMTLEVISLLKQGKIGEPRYFNALFSYQIKAPNIRLNQSLRGGALFDIGIYCINAARAIFRDEPERVSGHMIRGQDARFAEVDGTTCATLIFPRGRVATFTASFAAFERSLYEIVGTDGSIRVEPAFEYVEGLAFTIFTKYGVKRRSFKRHDQFAAELAYFSKRVLSGEPIEPDGKEGLADIEIIEAIIASNQQETDAAVVPIDVEGYPDKEQASSFPPTRKKPSLIGVASAS